VAGHTLERTGASTETPLPRLTGVVGVGPSRLRLAAALRQGDASDRMRRTGRAGAAPRAQARLAAPAVRSATSGGRMPGALRPGPGFRRCIG